MSCPARDHEVHLEIEVSFPLRRATSRSVSSSCFPLLHDTSPSLKSGEKQDEGVLLPLRESIRAAAAGGGLKSGGAVGLSAHNVSNFNKKLAARESVDGLLQAHKARMSQRRSSLPTNCNPSDASKPGQDSLTSKIEKIRMSMDHMLRVSLSPPAADARTQTRLSSNTIALMPLAER